MNLETMREWGDRMPGGFFVYYADDKEELIYANDVVFRIFGCDTKEEFFALTGGTFPGIVYRKDLDRVQASIRKQVKADEDKLDYVEYRIIRKDGSICWVDDYGRLVHTEDAGPVYYVLIRDITEKHEAERQKMQMELELDREKHTNEIKTAFLFNVSHDIRTPMNAIKGFTDLAIMHMDEPALLRDYLKRVDESNKHMIRLIDDLLEMSRLEYGRVELQEGIANIDIAMQDLLTSFGPDIEKKKLELQTELDFPNRLVYMDEGHFTRALENVVGNAVKFTPEGGKIRILARQRQVSDAGYARFQIIIEDNGIGMSEDFMNHMFEAFEREENSTQSGYLGTGLGLTITKRILDVMGGTITIKSKKGEGTKVTIALPLKLAIPGETRTFSGLSVMPKAAGEKRILLVEDVEENRMLAEHVLLGAGFLVDSVPDGSDAVETIRQKPAGTYDLILMDIQMPVMNGYEATRAIRAMNREDTAVLPIIALSANAREEDKRMSIESGMNAHVAKPFDISYLIDTINDHVKKNNRRTTL